MLFAMLSTFNCCAFMPLAALKSARIISSPRSSNFCNFLDGFTAHVVRDRNGLLHHFELAHDAHQPHRSMRGAHVGSLDLSLMNRGIDRVGGRLVAGVAVVIAALFQ